MEDGYVPAGALRDTHHLRAVRTEGFCAMAGRRDDQSLQPRMRNQNERGDSAWETQTKTSRDAAVPVVHEGVQRDAVYGEDAPLLQSIVCVEESRLSESRRDSRPYARVETGYVGSGPPTKFSTHEGRQPDARRKNSGQGEPIAEWAHVFSARRQREDDEAAKIAARVVGASDGVHDRDSVFDSGSVQFATQKLHGRFGRPNDENSDRSRRQFAQNTEMEISRSSQGSDLGLSRVVRVEVLERGNTEQPGASGCADSLVYNLEAEGDHNYFIRSGEHGVLVSNCHLLQKGKSRWSQNALEIVGGANRVIGATGTPLYNKPSSIYNLLAICAPAGFGSYWDFTERYCTGHPGSHGWETGDPSNMDEFRERLPEIMLRREWGKGELKDQLIPTMRKIERAPISNAQCQELDLIAATLNSETDELTVIGQLARYRKLVGTAKAVPAAALLKQVTIRN